MAEEIAADLGDLVASLKTAGVRVVASRYDAQSFGNFFIDFEAHNRRFRIVRDRLQYFLTLEREELETASLRRAFDDKDEFQSAVLAWVGRVRVSFIVPAVALVCLLSCGARLSERKYCGHYRWGFEISEFRPCGSSEKWWASGDVASLKRVHEALPPGPDPVVFVVWYGKTSGKGSHGHLGAYDRELTVTRFVEARLPKSGDCP